MWEEPRDAEREDILLHLERTEMALHCTALQVWTGGLGRWLARVQNLPTRGGSDRPRQETCRQWRVGGETAMKGTWGGSCREHFLFR